MVLQTGIKKINYVMENNSSCGKFACFHGRDLMSEYDDIFGKIFVTVP